MAANALFNRFRVFILFAMALVMTAPLFAQDEVETEKEQNIIEVIEETSAGNITIDIPDNLIKLIEPVKASEIQDNTKRYRTKPSGHRQISGYRIQIFSDGRNQSTLKRRATARANSVIAKFPQYRNQVYSFSKAPNWYTRVGNFKTEREANAALMDLRRAFPSFAGEMRIVRSNIVVIE